MLHLFKPKSDFSKNVLTLMTGTIVAQAIPIIISPILTRLYTPEDFGLFGLFMGLAMILSSLVSGKYELAILLPEKEEDVISIFSLTFFIICFISIVLFIIIFIFNDDLVEMLNNKDIKYWLYFIPFVTFFVGLFNLLTYYHIRLKNYRVISNASVIKSLTLALFQLLIGFFKNGVTGLISGQIVSQMFANINLFRHIIESKKEYFYAINRAKLLKVALRYIDFPKFSVWSVLLNSSVVNLVNIFIPILFGYATLGFYMLAQRVLGLPSMVLGQSIGKVFYEEAVSQKKKFGSTQTIFLSTLKRLFLMGFVIFTLLFMTIEDVIYFVFGKDWLTSAFIIKILIPLFFIRFMSSSLSSLLMVYEKQRVELIVNMVLFFTTMILLFINQNDFIKFLTLYSLFMSINYLILLSYMYRLSKGDM